MPQNKERNVRFKFSKKLRHKTNSIHAANFKPTTERESSCCTPIKWIKAGYDENIFCKQEMSSCAYQYQMSGVGFIWKYWLDKSKVSLLRVVPIWTESQLQQVAYFDDWKCTDWVICCFICRESKIAPVQTRHIMSTTKNSSFGNHPGHGLSNIIYKEFMPFSTHLQCSSACLFGGCFKAKIWEATELNTTLSTDSN